MGDAIWVTIMDTRGVQVGFSSFDTDDAGCGMAVGYLQGYADAKGLTLEDNCVGGLERYDLVNPVTGTPRLVATVT